MVFLKGPQHRLFGYPGIIIATFHLSQQKTNGELSLPYSFNKSKLV